MTQGLQRIESERLYLRELQESDITDEYLSWFADMDVTEFLEVRNLTFEEVRDYIVDGKKKGLHYMYAVCLKENDRHIGNIKVGPINRKHMLSDLVVVIGDKASWGKGFATEAIKLGNKLAFEVYGIRKLTGGMYSDNIGSIKCYTKADWIIEGRLVGHYVLNNKVMDRVCVSCFNPKFYDVSEDGKVIPKPIQ